MFIFLFGPLKEDSERSIFLSSESARVSLFGLGDEKVVNRKPVVQTEGVEFERRGRLADKEGLTKQSCWLYYGRFWSLTPPSTGY